MNERMWNGYQGCQVVAFDEGRLAPAASQKVPTVLKEQDEGSPGMH